MPLWPAPRAQRAERRLQCDGRFTLERRSDRLGYQKLCRAQTLEFCSESLRSARFEHRESSRAKIEPREAEATFEGGVRIDLRRRAERQQRGNQGFASLLEQRCIGDCARRDDTHHGAFHGTLGFGRITDLFADRHRFAFAHEPGEIIVDRVERDTGHRDRRTGGVAAGRERDVEQLRSAACVVIEKFVEIAHAIKEQHVRVLCLQAQVLLHHRGVVGGAGHLRIVPDACEPAYPTRPRLSPVGGKLVDAADPAGIQRRPTLEPPVTGFAPGRIRRVPRASVLPRVARPRLAVLWRLIPPDASSAWSGKSVVSRSDCSRVH